MMNNSEQFRVRSTADLTIGDQARPLALALPSFAIGTVAIAANLTELRLAGCDCLRLIVERNGMRLGPSDLRPAQEGWGEQ